MLQLSKPAALASALYKLVYGSARMAKSEQMKEVEGMKAFFLNDPSQAVNEIRDLSQLDLNKDGTIDTNAEYRISENMSAWELADLLLNKPAGHFSFDEYNYFFMP